MRLSFIIAIASVCLFKSVCAEDIETEAFEACELSRGAFSFVVEHSDDLLFENDCALQTTADEFVFDLKRVSETVESWTAWKSILNPSKKRLAVLRIELPRLIEEVRRARPPPLFI